MLTNTHTRNCPQCTCERAAAPNTQRRVDFAAQTYARKMPHSHTHTSCPVGGVFIESQYIIHKRIRRNTQLHPTERQL